MLEKGKENLKTNIGDGQRLSTIDKGKEHNTQKELSKDLSEMLKEMPKQTPGEHWKKKRLHDVTVTPTLKDIGIEKHESSRYQKIAELPEEKF